MSENYKISITYFEKKCFFWPTHNCQIVPIGKGYVLKYGFFPRGMESKWILKKIIENVYEFVTCRGVFELKCLLKLLTFSVKVVQN